MFLSVWSFVFDANIGVIIFKCHRPFKWTNSLIHLMVFNELSMFRSTNNPCKFSQFKKEYSHGFRSHDRSVRVLSWLSRHDLSHVNLNEDIFLHAYMLAVAWAEGYWNNSSLRFTEISGMLLVHFFKYDTKHPPGLECDRVQQPEMKVQGQ